jgi:hypothetical protein
MSGIILDRTGATSTGLRSAEEMSNLFNAGSDILDYRPDLAASVVQVDDRFVATGAMANLSMSVWVEGEADVFIQFFPKDRVKQFSFRLETFARDSDRIAQEVLVNAMGREARAVADFFPASVGHMREAVGARGLNGGRAARHQGMDLHQVTVLGLFRRLNTKSLATGNSRWAEVTLEFIQRHDRLAGELQQRVGQ